MLNRLNWSVTVKARVEDAEQIEAAIFEYTESLGSVALQEDVYFNVPNGELKLRIIHPNRCGQLIFDKGKGGLPPRLNESRTTDVEDIASLRETLCAALGELGVIRMQRRMFVKDNVHIHLDVVEDNGQFIEIMIDVPDASNENEGTEQVKQVQSILGIADNQLVPAYLDVLMRGNYYLTDFYSDSDQLKTVEGGDQQSVSSLSASS